MITYDSVQKIIKEVTIRLITGDQEKSIKDIIGDFFIDKEIDISDEEWAKIERDVAACFTELYCELCRASWSNMSYSEETRIKTLEKKGDRIIETIVVRKPSQLPPAVLLRFAEEGFHMHRGDVEQSEMIQKSPLGTIPLLHAPSSGDVDV